MLFIVGERVNPESGLDVAVATLDPVTSRPGDWIVDSRVISHVTGSVGAFIDYRPYRHSDSTNESNTPQLVPLSTGPEYYDFVDFATPAVVIETPDKPTELVLLSEDSSPLVAVSENPNELNEPILPPKPDEPKEPTLTPGDPVSVTCQGVPQVCRRCGDNLSIDINWQPASVLHRPDMSADRSKSVCQDPDPTNGWSDYLKLSRFRLRVGRSGYK